MQPAAESGGGLRAVLWRARTFTLGDAGQASSVFEHINSYAVRELIQIGNGSTANYTPRVRNDTRQEVVRTYRIKNPSLRQSRGRTR